MARLEGKVAIITGAASGQGAVEAKLFANEGAKVVATDFNEEALNKNVDEINANGGEAIAVKHDVTSKEDWDVVVQKAIEAFGEINILVNNAGITGEIMKPIEDFTVEEWDKILDVNAKGPFLGTKAVIPEMKKAGGGSIVNISSLSGLYGLGNPAYNSSKGAVRLLTKNIALDYGKHNIRCNSIHPGTIETPMTKDFVGHEEGKQAALQGIPLGVLGQPEDVAYAVLFLASDESKFITGAEVVIDGGSILI